MKITFIYKGRYFLSDAVAIEYLSAIAKECGHETFLVYDQDLFGISDNVFPSPYTHSIFYKHKKLVNKILAQESDCIIFLDIIGNNSPWIFNLAGSVKTVRKQTKTVLLSLVKDYPDSGCIDHQLIGEPEFTFQKFLNDKNFEGKKQIFEGLVDLNAIPLPDKGLFAPYVNYKDSYMVFTSKGCSYSCSYCIETVVKNYLGTNYFRRRSPENVILELKQAKERYSLREVIYKDSIFGYDKEWLRTYLGEYKKHIDLPYKCFGKVGVFDMEIAQMLKDSKCYCIEFGVQTFNESLKQDVLQRKEKTESVLNAFEICDKLGLMYDSDHIFGIPGESIEDHVNASKVYSRLKCLNRIKCHNLVFYRNSKIFKYAPEEVKSNLNYVQDFFSGISGSEEMIFANKCFQKYFKCLPLFSRKINAYLQKSDNWRIFRFVPGFMVFMIMVINALKNKDKRFGIYFKYYPKKILSVIVK